MSLLHFHFADPHFFIFFYQPLIYEKDMKLIQKYDITRLEDQIAVLNKIFKEMHSNLFIM